MSDRWDFYLCRVNEQLASIFVDLAIAEEAPLPALPYLGYVRVYLQEPREDGLADESEFEMLSAIEDRVTAALCEDGGALYVGRTTSAGVRVFFFYTNRPTKWEALAGAVTRRFPGYEFESGAREDAAWATYLDFLFPNAEQRERMQNRRLCESLRQGGDPLTAPRDIEHWASFASAAEREIFVEQARQLGFALRRLIEPDAEGKPFTAQIYRRDLPDLGGIDEVTLPLFRLARDCSGVYEGWDTELMVALSA
jgi:hypothetical protein